MLMKYSILFVEDDAMLSEIYEHALTDAGFDVVFATCEREVISALNKSSIDLVLLDMILPNESGLEILQKIKKNYVDVPVIMFTNLTAPQERDAAFDLGALAFLEKSKLTPRELAQEVERYCEQEVAE